jgi:hypothetical protein
VRPAKIEVGDNLEGHVRQRLADGPGPKAGLQCCRVVTGQPELEHLVGQRAAEALLVADGLRERSGLVEECSFIVRAGCVHRTLRRKIRQSKTAGSFSPFCSPWHPIVR